MRRRVDSLTPPSVGTVAAMSVIAMRFEDGRS
jgi:hypothetical protein